MTENERLEALGPAERIVQALTRFTDHLVHNRAGIVVPDPSANIGVRWHRAGWRKQDNGEKHVFRHDLQGKKTIETLVGVLGKDGKVRSDGRVVAEYRKPGIFPEVAAYMYRQVAEVFRVDNEFAARWASWAMRQDKKDLKTILAAFMFAQPRCGDAVKEGNEVLFFDDDYRAIGEAMVLSEDKSMRMSPRRILLLHDVMELDVIRKLNVELGFSKTARRGLRRRYDLSVHKWLQHVENNPPLLNALVKDGQGNTIKGLVQSSRYQPKTQSMYRRLRWSQTQNKDGHREIGLDLKVGKGDSWEGLTEAQVCERIVKERPGWHLLSSKLPSGLTRAIMAAAVEAGSLSDKELLILTPTLEELGLLTVEPVASRFRQAVANAKDQRARNIARNVKSKVAKDLLAEAADVATTKAIEEVTRDLRTYFIVDKSGSMTGAIETAKDCLTKFLGGFPLERTHVSVFNTVGSEVRIQKARSAAVAHAFASHRASGGTMYSEGVRALAKYQPKDEEDVLYIFVGDEDGEDGSRLADVIRKTGHRPTAFAHLCILGNGWGGGRGTTVRSAATHLKIPYFEIEQALFSDPYAVTVLANLIASTPVGETTIRRPQAPPRVTLVEQILQTPLLEKPVWA